MPDSAKRVARRFYASYFEVGTIVLFGKYKNHRGKVVKFGQDKWGNPTIEIEPIPKGRKQNKVLGLFKIWRADVKEKALADMVNQKLGSVHRIVARYVKAYGIDVGRTLNVGSIRIHRYRGLITVHDLTNAGMRGKKVKVLRITLGYGSPVDQESWFDDLAKSIVHQDTYQGVKNLVQGLKQDDSYVSMDEQEERGIDVEPTGSKITLKTNTGLVIESAPNDFNVLNHQPLINRETGKVYGYQDTNYYTRDKKSAAAFFTWIQANLSQVNVMTMNNLREVWDKLDVKYDYH